jgi:hypothetical protein
VEGDSPSKTMEERASRHEFSVPTEETKKI